MAHLYRPVAVKPIPAAAVLRTIDGVRCATWTSRANKKIVAPLTPNGLKCRVTSPTWWIEYVGLKGKERVKGFKDKQATQHHATALERAALDIRAGFDAPRHDSPEHLADHLPAFRLKLEQGAGESHVEYVVNNIRNTLTGLGLTTLASVNCERITNWLEQERKRAGSLPETFNRHVKHLRQFGRWLMRSKRAKFNPFDGLETVAAAKYRTKFRRRLTDFEFERLLTAARDSKLKVHGLLGEDRARLYLLAAYTGLRMGALRQLTPEAFTWSADKKLPEVVNVTARMAKNAKAHRVPLHRTVAKELATWLRSRDAGVPIFPTVGAWKERGSQVVSHDLEAARVAWIAEAKSTTQRAERKKSDTLKRLTTAGEVFDFHAFRVHFISGLALAGVPLTAAQQLADHSTSTLTANVYSKWAPTEMAAQVAKLPAAPVRPGKSKSRP